MIRPHQTKLCLLATMLSAATVVFLCGCGGSDDNSVTATSSWAALEIDGIASRGPVLVISGAGYDIERVPGFTATGSHLDAPGHATNHPFIFEVAATNAAEYRAYFDAYLASPGLVGARAASIIVLHADGSDAYRWTLTGFVPFKRYEAGSDGRVRFTMSCAPASPTVLGWDLPIDPFGSGGSFNPATDRRVEVDGLAGTWFPQVVIDEANRTFTCTYDFAEGNGIFAWVKAVIQGTASAKGISVISIDSHGTELSRRNFTGCFPIGYEQIAGYDLDTRAQARVIIAYNGTD